MQQVMDHGSAHGGGGSSFETRSRRGQNRTHKNALGNKQRLSRDQWYGSTWEPEEQKGPAGDDEVRQQQRDHERYVGRHANHDWVAARGRTKMGDRSLADRGTTKEAEIGGGGGSGRSSVVLEEEGRRQCSYQDGSHNFAESCSIVKRSASSSPGRELSPIQNKGRRRPGFKALSSGAVLSPERQHAPFPSRYKALPEAATPVQPADHLGFSGPMKVFSEAAAHYPGHMHESYEVQRPHMHDSLNLFNGLPEHSVSVTKEKHPGFFPAADLAYSAVVRKPTVQGLVSLSNERHFAVTSRDPLESSWELAPDTDPSFVAGPTPIELMVTTHQSAFGTNPESFETGQPVVRMVRHDGGQMYPIGSQVVAETLPVRHGPGWRGGRGRHDGGQLYDPACDPAYGRAPTWPLDTSTEQTFLED